MRRQGLENAVECGFLRHGKNEIRTALRKRTASIVLLRINTMIQSLARSICIAT